MTIADPDFHNEAGERSAQVINVDTGKHIAAVVLCAAVCGMSVVFAWRASLLATETTIEYRVLLNHTVELEANQKALANRIEEIRNERK